MRILKDKIILTKKNIIRLINDVKNIDFNHYSDCMYEGYKVHNINLESLSLSANKIKMVAFIISLFKTKLKDKDLFDFIYYSFFYTVDNLCRVENNLVIQDDLIFLLDQFNNSHYINKQGDCKDTFLHIASIYYLPKVLDYLLARNVFVMIQDDIGETPFHKALRCCPIEYVEKIYEKAQYQCYFKITEEDIINSKKNEDKSVYRWVMERYREENDPVYMLHNSFKDAYESLINFFCELENTKSKLKLSQF